jgi:hypothetical protein
MVQYQENMEVAMLVRFCVYLRNVVQAETGVLACCLGGFANSLMTSFLVTFGMLHHGDTTELVNNIHYLLFDPLDQTHDAQHS